MKRMNVFKNISDFVTKVFQSFSHNWVQKIVCFVVALGAFFLNVNKNWSVTGISVKTTLKIEGNDMVVSAPYTPLVELKLHGPEELVSKLGKADFEAYVDTSYAAVDGEYELPVLLKLSERASEIDPLEIKVVPETIHLKLENKVSAFIDVEPFYGGMPDFGYEVTSVSVEPTQIEISGGKSIVEASSNLKARTNSINIDGAKSSVEKKIRVKLPNVHLHSETDEVSVVIKISPIKSSKTFEKIPVNLININSNLELASFTESVSLSFDGNLADLETYRMPTNFVTVDCGNIKEAGKYELKINVNAPKYFTAAKSNQKTVTVVFNSKPIIDENIEEGF